MAKEVIAIVDHTKWGQVGFVSFVSIDQVDCIITDDGAPPDLPAAFRGVLHAAVVAPFAGVVHIGLPEFQEPPVAREGVLALLRGDARVDLFLDALFAVRPGDVIFIAKSVERIGDHCKNIAEDVIYIVKGRDVRHIGLDALERAGLLPVVMGAAIAGTLPVLYGAVKNLINKEWFSMEMLAAIAEKRHPQGDIADLMSLGVIEILEPVEIDDNDGDPVIGIAEGLRQARDEAGPVRQARQAVMQRHVAQAGLGTSPIGDVLEGQYPAPARHRAAGDGDDPVAMQLDRPGGGMM